jgi:hypothetical protein
MESRTRLAQKALDTAELYLQLRLFDPARGGVGSVGSRARGNRVTQRLAGLLNG